MNFSRNGYDVSFDVNGDPVAIYELVNWQQHQHGSIEMVTVGLYDASLPKGQEFRISRNLTWMDGGTHVRSTTTINYITTLLEFQIWLSKRVQHLP